MIKGFTLGGVDWVVEIDNEKLDDKQAYGYAIFDESKILIQTKTNGVDRNTDAIDKVLYHEVCHAILDTLGEHTLSSNEEFVSKFATLLHQFEKTKE